VVGWIENLDKVGTLEELPSAEREVALSGEESDPGRRMAVVGAGPAGLYALQALLALPEVAAVDVFDGLPAPYGLVRYGVAPDHAKTKTVVRTFVPHLESPKVRFVGNVWYGRDIHLDDLRRLYDATVFATGAPGDRRLDIPGEDLAGSDSATRFVNWYCGLPAAPPFRLDGATTAVVIGAGNVALDVARILARDADELTPTDVPDVVLEILRQSTIRDVHLVARRGPAQAKYSTVELREMGDLDNADIVVDATDLDLDRPSREVVESTRSAAITVRVLGEWAKRDPAGRPRRVYFHFWTRPVEILGSDAVTGVVLEKRQLDDSGATVGTSRSTVDAQLVLRAVGYRSHPMPGLPFDDSAAVIPNDAGRILDGSGPVPGLYVAGWLKRGPTGVIGTNRSDAVETVKSLAADLSELPWAPERDPDALPGLLASRGVPAVDWAGWERLRGHEVELGGRRGAASVKLAELAEMLEVCRPAVGGGGAAVGGGAAAGGGAPAGGGAAAGGGAPAGGGAAAAGGALADEPPAGDTA
jgi:ferredoxin--NADP+ reductase